MTPEFTTKAIPAMISKIKKTGLITQESIDALEAKRLQAGEKIRDLLKMQKKGIISVEQAKAEIERIQEAIQEAIQDGANALEPDEEILT